MKIGILTMHRPHNFGSALQCYATFYTCRKLGLDASIVDYVYPTRYHLKRSENEHYHNKLVFFLRKIGFQWIFDLLKKSRCIILWRDYLKIQSGKEKFRQFLHQMKMTPEYYHKDLKNVKLDCDILMTGSDQTWNPLYLHDDYTFLLDFAPDNIRKISYASSFGSSAFPEQYREKYAELLKKYEAVSVREESGAAIYKDLTGKECPAVLDPTLLLNKDEWCSLIADRSPIQEKFILCYLLFYFNPFPHAYKVIDQIHALTGYKVKFLFPGFWNYPKKKGYEYIFDAGPLDFLQLYRDASFVVAASFHGTAFAVNFQKDFFAVTDLESKSNIRVRNFLNTVGFTGRGLPVGSEVRITNNQLHMDYQAANACMQSLREKSISYLENVVK